jgi:KRAB domain-containing zinc finger protein
MFTIIERNQLKRKLLFKIVEDLNLKLGSVTTSSDRVYIHLDVDKSDKTETTGEIADVNIKNVFKHHCKQCSMTLPTDESLQKHVKIVHRNTNKSVICEVCGKDCKKTTTLKAHLNTHEERTCPHCFKTLKSHSHFRVHVKNHESYTKRERKKSYSFCSACSYKSLNKMSLEAHFNKMHLKIRPYICDICLKGFYKKSNLTEHVQTHDKTKKITCEVCGDHFFNKKTLNEHLRLHSNIKPFPCQICNERFVTSGRRSDHFKRKHMDKSICCVLCDKKFSLKKELNTHMKKVHRHGQDPFSLVDNSVNMPYAETMFYKNS